MLFAGVSFDNAAIGGETPPAFTWQTGEYGRRAFRVAWSNQEIVQLLGRGGDRATVRAMVADTTTLAALKALADAGTVGTLSGVSTPEGVQSYPDVRLDTVGQEQWIAWSDPPVLFCTLVFWRQAV